MTLGSTDELRLMVENRLRSFLADKRSEAERSSAESIELVDQVATLTMRGGKRLRPIVIAAAYRAVRPGGDLSDVIDAGASIELLQSYLLIHDDWMDLDDERRGGPSVYAALRELHGHAHLGASLAVLAGDLASAYASELITRAPFPVARREMALDSFWEMQREVFFGQQLDLVASSDVERVYDLKTASYTVRGPARIGAFLGGADEAALDVLARWSRPIGIAFQLRDEILGTFGDPRTTGKPAGNDLRAGKLTTLVVEARRALSNGERAPLEAVFGQASATSEDVARAIELLVRAGVRAKVQTRLDELVAESNAALADAAFDTSEIGAIGGLLVDRSH